MYLKINKYFVIEDIKCSAKFTARSSNSIDAHLNYVENVKEDYSSKLNLIEEEYNISYNR
ncbi:MAG: hypothetical protein B6U87_01495 [Candidatus Aenigmarchaeota archaeon ex4484_52]|nr:MAG: hypothetical protein B6U87_01495 [Candidatus Aenigmarchaeota archaeon ex4484_52]